MTYPPSHERFAPRPLPQNHGDASQHPPAPQPEPPPQHAEPEPQTSPVPQPLPLASPTPPPHSGPVTGFVVPGTRGPQQRPPSAPQSNSTSAFTTGVPQPPQPPTWTSTQSGPSSPPRDPRRRGGTVALVSVVAVVASLIGGALGSRLATNDSVARSSVIYQSAEQDNAALSRQEGSVADIAAQVLPSVVAIEVYSSSGGSTGSGFVMTKDGYILTNEHVVAEASSANDVIVTFFDGTEHEAEVVGSTVEYDLAVLKIDRDDLTALPLGNSDDVVVGDTTIAIGAPLGLQGTVTTGIVSALNRPVSAGGGEDDISYINAIQTDAAINPGNSGGPLVNARGEVIGVNSAIAQPPGSMVTSPAGSIGLGFAIGSNQAARTAGEIIERGYATYPIIGVVLDSTYQGQGVQVIRSPQGGSDPVTPDGPADRAGIEAGDVITAIDERPVTYADELIVAIRAKAPGDTVTLTVRTSGGERQVEVTLDEARSE